MNLNALAGNQQQDMALGRAVVAVAAVVAVGIAIYVACMIIKMYLWDEINGRMTAAFAAIFAMAVIFSPVWAVAALIFAVRCKVKTVEKEAREERAAVYMLIDALKTGAAKEAGMSGTALLFVGVADTASACIMDGNGWGHHLVPVIFGDSPDIYLPGSGMIAIGVFMLIFNRFSRLMFLTDDAVQVKKKRRKEKMRIGNPYEED